MYVMVWEPSIVPLTVNVSGPAVAENDKLDGENVNPFPVGVTVIVAAADKDRPSWPLVTPLPRTGYEGSETVFAAWMVTEPDDGMVKWYWCVDPTAYEMDCTPLVAPVTVNVFDPVEPVKDIVDGEKVSPFPDSARLTVAPDEMSTESCPLVTPLPST